MAATTENIRIPGEQWVELYTASSIAAGTQISTQNIGVTDLYYTVSNTQPPRDSNKYRVFLRGQIINNVDNDQKLWIFSPQSDGLVNIALADVNSISNSLVDIRNTLDELKIATIDLGAQSNKLLKVIGYVLSEMQDEHFAQLLNDIEDL